MTTPQPESTGHTTGYSFRWWWVVLLLALIGFALFGDKGVLRLVKTYNHRTDLQHQVEELVAENQRLKEAIHALQHDHATIERIARQELGMVRKDEIVYQFPKQNKPLQKSDESSR